MATVVAVHTPLKTFGDEVHIFEWSPLTTTDNYGSPVELPGWPDRSIQLTGTLGTGGAVTIYGSNRAQPNLANDDDWFVLTDPQGNNIVLNALKGEAITELTRWLRPKVTAGDASTSLTATLLLSKPWR